MTRSDSQLGAGAGQKHTTPIKSMLFGASAWAVAVVFALGAGGCRDRAAAQSYACECAFLTDMDDASKQLVQVCETSKDRAESAAVGCAQSGAPATIQSCACKQAPTGKKCNLGDCAVSEHR